MDRLIAKTEHLFYNRCGWKLRWGSLLIICTLKIENFDAEVARTVFPHFLVGRVGSPPHIPTFPRIIEMVHYLFVLKKQIRAESSCRYMELIMKKSSYRIAALAGICLFLFFS